LRSNLLAETGDCFPQVATTWFILRIAGKKGKVGQVLLAEGCYDLALSACCGRLKFKKRSYNSFMSLTALELTAQDLKQYRPLEAIRRRKTAARVDLAKRRRLANQFASQAAKLLRREFKAEKIYLFGSLSRSDGFTLWSDIDIAVCGILPARFFEAVGAVTGISADFKIDLIDLDACPSAMREIIEKDGIAL